MVINFTHTYTKCDRSSTILWQNLAQELPTHEYVDIAIIMSNIKGLAKNTMRMVVRRNGRLSTLCLDCKCLAVDHNISHKIQYADNSHSRFVHPEDCAARSSWLTRFNQLLDL